MASFKINVTKDYLVFSAAHFITYSGHQCESLHGHNYRVRVILEGAIDENWYVYDFVTLKRLMKRLIDELDHHVLIPLNNPMIKVGEHEQHINVSYKDRRYTFPKQDVVLLPMPNTTAEMLAQYLTMKVKEELVKDNAINNIYLIELEVEESFGQSATFREITQEDNNEMTK